MYLANLSSCLFPRLHTFEAACRSQLKPRSPLACLNPYHLSPPTPSSCMIKAANFSAFLSQWDAPFPVDAFSLPVCIFVYLECRLGKASAELRWDVDVTLKPCNRRTRSGTSICQDQYSMPVARFGNSVGNGYHIDIQLHWGRC